MKKLFYCTLFVLIGCSTSTQKIKDIDIQKSIELSPEEKRIQAEKERQERLYQQQYVKQARANQLQQQQQEAIQNERTRQAYIETELARQRFLSTPQGMAYSLQQQQIRERARIERERNNTLRDIEYQRAESMNEFSRQVVGALQQRPEAPRYPTGASTKCQPSGSGTVLKCETQYTNY